ncbi:hypothetical protein [Shewanella waksmanii]|uniref:hypothetical protein n=1 Tax=Shewanella waksmanii TaxID=213783 RepID=UPI003736B23C
MTLPPKPESPKLEPLKFESLDFEPLDEPKHADIAIVCHDIEPYLARFPAVNPASQSPTYPSIFSFSRASITQLEQRSWDLILVESATKQYTAPLIQMQQQSSCSILFINNPSNDRHAITQVCANISAKLYSDEMPNNLDVADMRLFDSINHHLFAFNSLSDAIDFLQSNPSVTVTAALYLAHNVANLAHYQQAMADLAANLNDNCSFFTSMLDTGQGQCSILVCLSAANEQTL